MENNDLVNEIASFLRTEAENLKKLDPQFQKMPKSSYDLLKIYAKMIEKKFGPPVDKA